MKRFLLIVGNLTPAGDREQTAVFEFDTAADALTFKGADDWGFDWFQLFDRETKAVVEES